MQIKPHDLKITRNLTLLHTIEHVKYSVQLVQKQNNKKAHITFYWTVIDIYKKKKHFTAKKQIISVSLYA